MNPQEFDEGSLANASREEIMAALFGNMIMQLGNTALMFLGRIPHPETNETIIDLEAAKMFIDQLEMIEFKTKGNLDAEEADLLKRILSSLRMAFVEAFNAQSKEGDELPSATLAGPASTPAQPEATAEIPPPPGDEPSKRFSKKY
jgi:hypothetical protein